jgi:hypothetical protein
VPGFTAEALLALAFWPCAAEVLRCTWAERFHVAVPEQLIELLMHRLAIMEQENSNAAAAGKPSMSASHLATVLRMGATVVIPNQPSVMCCTASAVLEPAATPCRG